jgi:anti-anti-sigma regulatory factor
LALLVEREAKLVRLRPVGEWDTGLQRELEAEILSLAAIGARAFLIDLAAAHHIQYRVLPEVLGLFRQIRQLGGELAISSPDSYLLEILAAGDIPRTIPVFPSEASAALGIIDDAPAAVSAVPREGEREGSGLAI